MSFRTRLTSFFLLPVMIPMTAVGFLVFRLIDDSQRGKADAGAKGIASAAASVYEQARRSASFDARTVAGRWRTSTADACSGAPPHWLPRSASSA